MSRYNFFRWGLVSTYEQNKIALEARLQVLWDLGKGKATGVDLDSAQKEALCDLVEKGRAMIDSFDEKVLVNRFAYANCFGKKAEEDQLRFALVFKDALDILTPPLSHRLWRCE